ncbi:MAG: LacI family DNA-binding transcriptional regulator [Arachnia sp.]
MRRLRLIYTRGCEVAVTIRDVARACGVSPATVSRAISDPEKVNEATRTRIQAMAISMGYRPNPMARSLITGRSGTIGLIVPDLENPFFGSICKGAQARAREVGYTVFVADTDEDPTAELDIFQHLGKQVDGIIFCSARGTDADIARMAQETPTLLVNRTMPGIPSITYDNASGMRAMMDHLVALGHRRIAYAGGPVRSWSNDHRSGAFTEYGRTSAELDLVQLGNFRPTFSGGIQAGDLAIASGATAVVAFNDLVALGLMDRLRQRGMSAPGDMSVGGFDNVAVSTFVWPNLTTVDFPRIQMGRAAVDSLLKVVLGTRWNSEPVHEIPVELVIRQSTDVPAGGSHDLRPAREKNPPLDGPHTLLDAQV